MTVSSTDVVAQATGTGATATYSFSSKKLYSGDNLVVKTRVISTGVVATQVKDGAGTYDYTVSVESDFSGGTVTLNTILPTTHEITIERILPLTQLVTFPEEDAFPTAVVERAYDRAVMIAQQLKAEVDRCIKFSSETNDIGTVEFNTTVANRANKLFSFDASGNVSIANELGIYRNNWATATAYNVRDFVKDGSNNNIYFCITAHTSTGSTPISSNADVAKWALIVDAAAAAASASAAATSATNAATSETNAATSETNAATSAASAASYATTLSATQTYYTSGGSSNAYTITATPTLTAYAAGVSYFMKANHANTGAATLNVDGVGAKTITKNDGSALSAGDIPLDGIVLLTYDGTNFQLVGGAQTSSSDQVLINTLDIFANTIGDMSDHSDNVLNTVDGFTDDFQDGSTQNNTALDISDTSGDGITHDNTNKLWKNTAGATGQNADQDFTTEGNYDTFDLSGTDCSISSDTVTINAGDNFVDNKVLYARFSPEDPFNPANSAKIDTYTSTTSVDLETGHGLTATNSAWTVRFFEISSGEAQLSAIGGPFVDVSLSLTGGTGERDVGKNVAGQEYCGQTITTVLGGTLESIVFPVKKTGSPTDNYYVEVKAESGGLPTGAVLATSDNVDVSTLGTSYADQTWTFSGGNRITLSATTKYAFYLRRSGALDASNYIDLDGENTSTYSGGGDIFYRNSSWAKNDAYEHDFILNLSTASTSVINKYTPVFPTYANLADAVAWSEENSLAQTETLNSATVYYMEIFATASYGASTELKVTDGAGGNVRKAVRNNAGTWEYNSNATFGSETWTSATANNMAQAIIDAMGEAQNQMSGTTRAATTDAALSADTSVDRGTVAILYSTNTSNNPNVSQTRINYDDNAANADLQNRVFGGTNMPPVPGSNVTTLVLLAIDKQISGTPTYEVTSNGGTDWTTVSSWDISDLQANGYTNRLAEVTVSGQTAPRTDPRFRIRNGSTGESYELKAVGLKYK